MGVGSETQRGPVWDGTGGQSGGQGLLESGGRKRRGQMRLVRKDGRVGRLRVRKQTHPNAPWPPTWGKDTHAEHLRP